MSSEKITSLWTFKAIGFLVTITFMGIAMFAETDIYVPAFPIMLKDLGATEGSIQWVLSINFLSMAFASMIFGPLSDSYGRRIPLLVGLLFFTLSTIGCALASSLDMMLLARFLQGIACASPMVICYAVILDVFNMKRSMQICSFLGGVVTAAMAGAPVLGGWLTLVAGWRSCFWVIAIISLISLLGTMIFIPESLPKKDRHPFVIKQIYKNYKTLLTNKLFMSYSLITPLLWGQVMAAISQLSVVFINHFHLSLEDYIFFQVMITGSDTLASFGASYLLGIWNAEKVKKMSMIGAAFSSFSLFFVYLFFPLNPWMIIVPLCFISFIGGFSWGVFSNDAMELFPHLKGAASAMLSMIRLAIIALIVYIGTLLFDGTIGPLVIISLLCTFGSLYLYRYITKHSLQIMEENETRASAA